MITKVLICKCDHTAQDKMYGKQRRVHNGSAKTKSSESIIWRCTVCGNEQRN